MRTILTLGLSIFFGVASGLILGTAILAFITIIGIIPRLAEKGDVRTHFLAIGTAAVLGISTGSLFTLFDVYIPTPKILIGLYSLAVGMFIGCLSIALAEVLDVMPIAKSRMNLKKGMHIIIFVFSIAKMIGSLIYWFHPGFNFG